MVSQSPMSVDPEKVASWKERYRLRRRNWKVSLSPPSAQCPVVGKVPPRLRSWPRSAAAAITTSTIQLHHPPRPNRPTRAAPAPTTPHHLWPSGASPTRTAVALPTLISVSAFFPKDWPFVIRFWKLVFTRLWISALDAKVDSRHWG